MNPHARATKSIRLSYGRAEKLMLLQKCQKMQNAEKLAAIGVIDINVVAV